jgi:inorganic phosphate transporter, PiT family
MVSAFTLMVLVVLLAIVFDYINGFHDTANAVATVISTNVLPARTAVLLAAVANFWGAFVGTNVAKMIGGGIADPVSITQAVVAAALVGAIFWNLFTWYYGIPSSSSHALVGGLIGAVWAHRVLDEHASPGAALSTLLSAKGVVLTLKFLVISPVLGMLGGFLIMVLLLWIVKSFRPYGVNRSFRGLQLVSASFMAFSHGSNDAQKAMGIITLSLVSYYAANPADTPTWLNVAAWTDSDKPQLVVPWWVILACATAMGLGTASGGWRIIKTMGNKIIKLKPINGFAAETSAALVILGSAQIGAPVSTTHVISASIMGVGASKRVSAVRWGVAMNMILAWIVTIPLSAIVAVGTYFLLRLIGTPGTGVGAG